MKVRANQRGYFGTVREPGEAFNVPDDTVVPMDSDGRPGWFERIDEVEETEQRRGRRGRKDDTGDLA